MFGRRKRKEEPALSPETDASELESSGWQAIDDACTAIYGDQSPSHVGYQPPAAFSDNLQGCSAYFAGDHWHFVSYGLSELHEPEEDDDPEISGWGFELTMRVPGAGDSCPEWPFTMINEIAKVVNSSGTVYEVGHRIDLRQAVTGHPHLPDAPETGLTAFAVILDPQLGEITTPNGQVKFLQLVGITAAEKDLMIASSTDEVLGQVTQAGPLLLTRPDRAGA